jgi:hypothetical protein
VKRERGGERSVVEGFGSRNVKKSVVRRETFYHILEVDSRARYRIVSYSIMVRRAVDDPPCNSREVSVGMYLIRTLRLR